MLFSVKLLKSKNKFIRYVRAVENGYPAWFIIELKPFRFYEYQKKLCDHTMNLTDFGKILECGWGKPNMSQSKELTAKYGINIPLIE